MRSRFRFQFIAAAMLIFGSATMLQALPAVQVTESPQGDGTTEYSVTNNGYPSGPIDDFDVSVLLSTTTGSDPITTNAGWYAESLNAGAWDATMGEATGDFSLPTWQQYTGLTYTQAFPGNPTKLNGYFLDYTFNADADTVSYPANPIIPGSSLGGFFFTGDPASTFLAVGPPDPTAVGTTSFTLGAVDSFTGTSEDLPEPASLGLGTIALSGLALRRRRQIA
jgi:MYXO-CTERM domain-containing protein